jgi:hypothetical protein
MNYDILLPLHSSSSEEELIFSRVDYFIYCFYVVDMAKKSLPFSKSIRQASYISFYYFFALNALFNLDF